MYPFISNKLLIKLRHLIGSFLWLVEHICQVTFAAVLAIKVVSHEDAGTTALIGTLASQASDLAVLVHLVVLEHGQLDLLLLVLDLLGRGVVLLLALAAAASQSEHQVEGRLLLDIVVGQGASILQLLAGKDEPLLVGRDALFVLNFGFDVFDGVAGLDLQGDGLTS